MISRSPFALRCAPVLVLLLLVSVLSGCTALKNRNWPWFWQPKEPDTALVMGDVATYPIDLPPPIQLGGPEPLGPDGLPMPSGTALSISEVRPGAGARPAYGLEPIYFEYNSSDLGPEARERLAAVAQWILQNAPGRKVLVEGHCDSRGTNEYNLSLGHDRAATVREELYRLSIPPELVSTISYGEERPAPGAESDSEEAWVKNRRVQFLLY